MQCRKVYSMLILGELLWLSLLVATPYLASRDHGFWSTVFYSFFSHFCHQRPERSFFLFGEKLPVCARDTSLYVAAFISTMFYPAFRKTCSPSMPSKWYLLPFLLPMAIDGIIQLVGLRESTNFLRFVTGFWAGLIVPFYFIPLIMASPSVQIEDSHGSDGKSVHDVAQGPSDDRYEAYDEL